MGTTTIRVTNEAKQRLKELARSERRTVQATVDVLLGVRPPRKRRGKAQADPSN